MTQLIKKIRQLADRRLPADHRPAAKNLQTPAAVEQGNTARLVIVITFLLIFIMAARTPLDTDMWWHLRAGEEMIRSGRLLQTDVFSFTRAGTHWTNAFWLTDILMAWLFRWQAYLGLGAAVALCATASMALVFAQCEGPIFLKSAALLLGSVVASVVWSPRPQIVSLVLMALVGYLLYVYKWHGRNVLWALPVIFVFWANMHGGYPLGLILIGAMLAGETVNHLLGIDAGPVLTWRKIAHLAAWAIACGLAVLLNPNGLDMWRLPFQTVDMSALQQFIPEWASPDFHNLIEQTLIWLLLAVFAVVGLSGKRMDGSDLTALLAFAFMALLARRNFGPFALVAAPILTRYAATALRVWREHAPWMERLQRKESGNQPGFRVVRTIINLTLVALLGLVAFGKLYVVTQPTFVGHYLTEAYPSRAAAWLIDHRAGGRVFNEYNWGGYLLWELPKFPTFVDGRTDLFGDEVIGAWIEAVQANPGWPEILNHYQVDMVMLQPDRPLLNQLSGAGWTLIYQDFQAVIYERK